MPDTGGGFAFHNTREVHYAFVHIERAGKKGIELGDFVSQYELWGLPKDSYVGPVRADTELFIKYVKDPAYRKVAVGITPH